MSADEGRAGMRFGGAGSPERGRPDQEDGRRRDDQEGRRRADEGGRRWDDDAGRDDEGRERGVYIISVAAELVGVHPQTLRIYERKGLLSPSRTSGNTRRYSERDIATLQAIQRLTQEGVNLAGVKMIVQMQDELHRMRERMDQMRREMDRAADRLRQEVERARSQHRTEIVPFAEVRRLRELAFGEARSGGARPDRPPPDREAPGRTDGPAAVRRGPIAAGPGS
jgi:MerR family transcriptional regulator, heat shock protein HspR